MSGDDNGVLSFGREHKPLEKARMPSGAECPADRGLRESVRAESCCGDGVPARRSQHGRGGKW